jgi:hypothetical protein
MKYSDDTVEELIDQNERLRKEIIMLKDAILTLKLQNSELKSDLIVSKALERGKP